jgi:hypothetical protein
MLFHLLPLYVLSQSCIKSNAQDKGHSALEAKLEDVSVGHEVIPALQFQEAGLFDPGGGAQFLEGGEGHHFGSQMMPALQLIMGRRRQLNRLEPGKTALVDRNPEAA